MSEPNLKKTHELIEKLAVYVMNEVPKKGEVPTKQEMNEGFQRVEKEINEVKQNVISLSAKQVDNTISN